MNKTAKIFLIIAIPLAAVAFAIYFFAKSYIPKYRWDQSYSYKNDQPYGLKLLYDVLSNAQSKEGFVLIDKDPGAFLKGTDTASLYFFAGYNYVISQENVSILADFVERGNIAFISKIESDHSIFDLLTDSDYPTLYLNFYTDSVVNIAFNSQSADSVFQFHFQVGKKKQAYSWLGIDSVMVTDTLSYYGFESVTHLDNGNVDCFRIKHGKGWFIFQFNPLVFTNYHIANENGLRFVNTLFSGYKSNKIYWDEYSKVAMPSQAGQGNSKTPLRFILSERSLRWGWYLLCFLILLYVLINAKRKQARIPLVPENKNTTIEYLNSLATLHYQANSIIYITDEMTRQFLMFIKQKYGISPHLDKAEIAKRLVLKSGVPKENINNIFKYYREVKYNQSPEKQSLIELYKATEYFYQNCK